MSYDLLQMRTWSFPCLSTVCCLSSPCRAPSVQQRQGVSFAKVEGTIPRREKLTVVPLVELPRLRSGQPHQVGLLKAPLQSLDGALLHARERHAGDDAGRLDLPSGLDDLLLALGGEGAVVPSGELVLEVPSRLPVPDEDERVLVRRLLEGREAGRFIISGRDANGLV